MRKLSFLLCFLATVASAQVLTDKTGVNVQPLAYFQGSCSAGRVGVAKETGQTFLCVSGIWKSNDIPTCSPDPPGACVGSAACISQAAGNMLYLCNSSGHFSSITERISVALPGEVVTIGIDNGASTYSYIADSTTKDINVPLYNALAEHAASAALPLTIIVYPGNYNSLDTIDLSGKYVTINALEPNTVNISQSYTFARCTSNCTDFSLNGLTFTGGADVLYYSDPVSSPTWVLRNNRIELATGPSSSGMLKIYAAGVSPGPRFIVQSNYCRSGHYCIDVFGGTDTNGDNTTDAYATVESTGNVYMTNGNTIPPLYVNGPAVTFLSSGDTVVGDCVAFGIAAPSVTGIYSGTKKREISLTGDNLWVRQMGPTRADCSGYPLGPAAIVIGGTGLNTDAGVSADDAADQINVTGSDIYVQAQTSTTHSYFLHRGYNSRPVLSNNRMHTDSLTGLDPFRRTQSGAIYSVLGAADSSSADWQGIGWQTPTETGTTNMRLRFQLTELAGQFQMLYRAGIGGLSASHDFFFVTDTQPRFFVTTSAASGSMKSTKNQSGDTIVGTTSDRMFLGQNGIDDASKQGVYIDPYDYGMSSYPKYTQGSDYTPLFGCKANPADGTCATRYPWNYFGQDIELSHDGTHRALASAVYLASANVWWIDLNNDGAINSGDSCLTDAGIDADCNGVVDVTGFFAGQAKGALAACTSGAPCFMSLNGIAATTTTESDVYLISPASGLTVRSLQCRLPSAVASGTYTFFVRTAGTTDSGVTCSITSSATQCSDTAHTLAVAANTLMTVKVYGASTPTAEAYGLCTVGYTLF